MTEDKQWVDANGIAAHLGYDVTTVHRLTGPNVKEPDRIPHHHLTKGGHKMFHIPEVDEWLLKHT